jgi:orotidine-5'-phosphate decarboxylase
MSSPIIVALDMGPKSALELVNELDPNDCKVKVGSQLFTSGGPEIIKKLKDSGFDIFLDLKFHDIPNTVKKAIEASMELGVWMLNVHALGSKEMLRAASQVIKQSSIKPFLIGVTVLTSLDDKSLKLVGFNKFAEDQVLLLAELCKQEGLDGVVCSPKEVSILRKKLGDDFLLVTPGIRSNEMNKGDQKRTSSVELALQNGANYVVIGREITLDADPKGKLRQILETV